MDFRHPLNVVTPTLDADVLTVLARADTEMSGREIQRRSGRGSPQGVRNAADRLVREGVVERHSAAGANLYRLNRDHVAAQWIEALANLSEQVIENVRTLIAGWPDPPLLAMLFGSVATGLSTSTSDVDLLIVRPAGLDPYSPRWARQLSELQARTTAWSGNDARILEYGEDELAELATEPVLEDALRDGIELYGSRRALSKLMRSGIAR